MQTMQGIAAKVAPGVMAGTRGGRGRGAFGRGAGGFIPNYNAIMGYGSEQADINRGVGGAPSSAKPVAIPNFNFGGGQKGTMIANTSEFMVPNFAGSGGSAIFLVWGFLLALERSTLPLGLSRTSRRKRIAWLMPLRFSC